MTNKLKYYFQISTSSGVPIYRQIIDQVKVHVATGRLAKDVFLPSVRQVAKELEVNHMTVAKAYSILEREGVLESVRGRGMKVNSTKQSKKGLAKNEKAIEPLVRQVIIKAKQLSLNKRTVMDVFDTFWKEKSHES